MQTLKALLYLLILMSYATDSYATEFAPKSFFSTCFTPTGNCTQNIITEIGNAKESILVQAYNFTSKPIADALITAYQHNVSVSVIIDKSQISDPNSCLALLHAAEIPIWIDDKVAIAHSKVILIDDTVTLTGSFNFTNAAQLHNSENIIIISDSNVANEYKHNWLNRQSLSYKYDSSHS